VLLGSWNIWRARNDLIFKHIPASFNRWRVCCQSDIFFFGVINLMLGLGLMFKNILFHKCKRKAALVQPLVDWLVATLS
jgi:hypothetical protein